MFPTEYDNIGLMSFIFTTEGLGRNASQYRCREIYSIQFKTENKPAIVSAAVYHSRVDPYQVLYYNWKISLLPIETWHK